MLTKLDNHGLALIVSIVIMLLLSSLGVFSVSLLSTDTHISLDTLSSAQAFFIAEAGVQEVLYKLKNESAYRSDPSTVIGDIGEGDFSVDVSKDDTTYTLTSTGTVGEIERRVIQVVTVSGGGSSWHSVFTNYALFGNSENMEIKEGATITGSIFQYGDIELKENSTVTEYVYATGEIDAKEGTSYTEGELPDPLPTMPTLDTTFYDTEIAIAAGSGGGDQEWDNLDLAGGTVYVDGDAQINADGSITGPGTLVVEGDVELKENIVVGEDVTIIAGGNLEIKENASVESNCVLYSSEHIEFKESGIVTASSSMLTPGTIEAKESITFTGIMYAGGRIELKEESVVTGSIVSGTDIEVKENCSITHDPAQFPSCVPDGLEGGEGDGVSVTLGGWEEQTS